MKVTNKSELMKNAWNMFKSNQFETFSASLKASWRMFKDYKIDEFRKEAAKARVVAAKLRNNSQWSLADIVEDSFEVSFTETCHKQGAYYGIKVNFENTGNSMTVYVSEKAWDLVK